jgi:hypothetical protein
MTWHITDEKETTVSAKAPNKSWVEDLKIIKHLPIPRSFTGNANEMTVVYFALHVMKPGDSVLCKTPSQAAYLAKTIRSANCLGVTRMEADGSSTRVWKVKKDYFDDGGKL